MHASHHTLSLLASDLAQRLRGSTVSSAFTQERDGLCIAFADRPECLFISCAPDLPVLFLHASFVRAKRNSADILAGAAGNRLTTIEIHPSDRVLGLALSSGLLLEVQLFGPRSNVFLLDPQRIVLDAFKKPRQLAGTLIHRSALQPVPTLTRMVEQLSHPAPSGAGIEAGAAPHNGANPTTDRSAHAQSAPPDTLHAALKRGMPIVSPLVLHELFHRAGLPGGMLLGEMTHDGWAGLRKAATSIEHDLATPRFALVSTAAGALLHFSTIPLTHIPGSREEAYEDIHAALREFFTRRRSTEAFHQEHQHLRGLLRRRLEKAERVCDAIRLDTAETDRAATYRRYGALLMEHLEAVPKGATAWTAAGAEPSTAIPLLPSLSPVQNAQRYFEKAKGAERSRVMAGERLHAYASVLTHLRRLLAELDTLSSRSALRTFMKQQKESLRSLGALESPEDQERAPFRVFVVHGGFEVWAGKSSANNDDLTLHHARPEDLWFHARGASGSHVILKVSSAAGEPGKRARAEAAGIAAYYSKMRTARIVPVAMTRRKYVHKPKGAPPGTVVIAREEVVMATPALPRDHTHKTKDQHADA